MKITPALRLEIKTALGLGRLDESNSAGDPLQISLMVKGLDVDLLYFRRVLIGERNLSMTMFEKICERAGQRVAMAPESTS